mmetsp:Transcript_74988/g.242485  ORF Transcript_74988/g.242485 Transcript_74988/m.242485 type:complete len:261 (-) Transcript_74988:661-1443(-)
MRQTPQQISLSMDPCNVSSVSGGIGQICVCPRPQTSISRFSPAWRNRLSARARPWGPPPCSASLSHSCKIPDLDQSSSSLAMDSNMMRPGAGLISCCPCQSSVVVSCNRLPAASMMPRTSWRSCWQASRSRMRRARFLSNVSDSMPSWVSEEQPLKALSVSRRLHKCLNIAIAQPARLLPSTNCVLTWSAAASSCITVRWGHGCSPDFRLRDGLAPPRTMSTDVAAPASPSSVSVIAQRPTSTRAAPIVALSRSATANRS